MLDSIVLHSIVMHRAMPDLIQRASGVEVTSGGCCLVIYLLCKVVHILSLSLSLSIHTYIYIYNLHAKRVRDAPSKGVVFLFLLE